MDDGQSKTQILDTTTFFLYELVVGHQCCIRTSRRISRDRAQGDRHALSRYCVCTMTDNYEATASSLPCSTVLDNYHLAVMLRTCDVPAFRRLSLMARRYKRQSPPCGRVPVHRPVGSECPQR